MKPQPVFDADKLEAAVKRAVADPDYPIHPEHFTFYDEETQEPIVIYNRKGH